MTNLGAGWFSTCCGRSRSRGVAAVVVGAILLAAAAVFWPPSLGVRAQSIAGPAAEPEHAPVASPTLKLSNGKWGKLLTANQYEILRRAGIEPAYKNQYFDFKGHGTFACVACGQRLFSTDYKYDSGTGWPSFTRPLDSEAVTERLDTSHGMRRTEVVCTRCGGHLGHVFNDGPPPTGLRYCMNSAALTFFQDKHTGNSNSARGASRGGF